MLAQKIAGDYTGIPLKLARLLLVIVCLSGLAKLTWAQQAAQKANLPELLEKLRSDDDSVRMDAFEQLRSDPANLKSPAVQAALLDLLVRESQKLDADLLEAQKRGYPDNGDNTEWGEYYSDLYGVVESFADWNDPRQACILVDAIPSETSREIADHAKVTIPCLIKRSGSAVSMMKNKTKAPAMDTAKDAGSCNSLVTASIWSIFGWNGP